MTLLACLAAEAGALGLLALQPGGDVLLVAGALAGAAAGPLGPLVNTVLLRRTPSGIRGRVLGASTAVALTATPLAVLVSGGLIEMVGTQAMMFGAAGALALLALTAAVLPVLRQLDDPANPPPDAPGIRDQAAGTEPVPPRHTTRSNLAAAGSCR